MGFLAEMQVAILSSDCNLRFTRSGKCSKRDKDKDKTLEKGKIWDEKLLKILANLDAAADVGEVIQ